MRILESYREDHACFNDDIQGTGSVALASILAACRTQVHMLTLLALLHQVRSQGAKSKLRDQTIVVCGAGSAGMGVTQSLYEAMQQVVFDEYIAATG
jgi:malic enzyme